MRRSSTDETPYRRSPSLDSKPDTPPFTSGFHRFSGEFEYKRPPFAFGFHTTKGPQTSKGRYAQGKKYVVFYLDLSFIFLLELRRCRMAEGCMMALRYGMVFFNLLFWVSPFFFFKCLECVWVCLAESLLFLPSTHIFFLILFRGSSVVCAPVLWYERETDHAYRSCVQSPLCGWVELFLLPIQYFTCGRTLHCLLC